MEKSQLLSILIRLAHKDGQIREKEKSLIFSIGASHGVPDKEINELLADPERPGDFDTMGEDERFDCLYDLVHLMKVDGRIFDEEISYCMEMARKLGYPLEAVMELYGLVHANVRLTSEIQTLKKKYQKN